MPTIGVLSADLTANTASFDTNLSRARQTLSSTAVQMNRSLGSIERGFSMLNKSIGFLGITASAAAVAAFAATAVKAAADLGDLSERLGISTDRLQDYRAQALVSGASIEDMDNALSKFNTRLGQAGDGVDTAADGFRKLGINIFDTAGNLRATDDVFREFADAIARIDDHAKRAAAIAGVLGERIGPRLAAALGEGTRGFDESGRKIAEWGGKISEETIKAAKAFDDFAQLAGVTLKAWAANAAAEAPSLAERMFKPYIDWLTRIGKGMELLSRGVNTDNTSAPRTPPGAPSAPISGVTPGFGGPAPAAPPTPMLTSKQRADLAKALADAEEMSAKDAAEAWEAFNQYVIQLSEQRRKIVTDNSKAVADAEEMAAQDVPVAQVALNKQQQARANAVNATVETEEQAAAARNATVEWDALSRAYRVNTRELDILIEKQRLVKEGLSDDEAGEAARRQVDAAEELRKATAKQTAEVERSNEASRDFAHVIGTGLEDSMLRGAKAIDVAKSALQDFGRILLRVLLTKPIENAITGALGGFSFGSLFSGGAFGFGGSASVSGGISSFAGPGGVVSAGLGGFATGTDSAPPGLAWVGERGKELINFNGGEQVFRGDEIASLGGGGPTIYADLRGADVAAVQRLERFVAQINGSIESRAIAATSDAVRRGGAYSRAFSR